MKYEKVKGSKSPALLGLRKNLFEYWDTFEKLEDVLPSEDKFYNTLTNLAIRDKSYEHVLNVWKAFKMNTMKDLSWFVLKSSCFIIGLRFLNIQKRIYKFFWVISEQDLSAPCYSWDPMLRFTDVNSKLISDIEKNQFIESS